MLARILLKDIPKTVSYAMHPLLMPMFGILILFNSGTYISFLPFEFKRSVFLLVAICTLGIPLFFIPLFLYRRIILNIQMNSSQERIIPLVLTTISFFFAYYLLSGSSVPKALQVFLLGSTLCVAFTLVITLKWKISAHMIGLGGIVGLIVSLAVFMHSNVMAYLILFIFLSGITATSRLLLDSHTPAQVYSGFGLGFMVMFCTILFF